MIYFIRSLRGGVVDVETNGKQEASPSREETVSSVCELADSVRILVLIGHENKTKEPPEDKEDANILKMRGARNKLVVALCCP